MLPNRRSPRSSATKVMSTIETQQRRRSCYSSKGHSTTSCSNRRPTCKSTSCNLPPNYQITLPGRMTQECGLGAHHRLSNPSCLTTHSNKDICSLDSPWSVDSGLRVVESHLNKFRLPRPAKNSINKLGRRHRLALRVHSE